MKIVKEAHQRCKDCQSLIEFEEHELLVEVLDTNHTTQYINCPKCGVQINYRNLYIITP